MTIKTNTAAASTVVGGNTGNKSNTAKAATPTVTITTSPAATVAPKGKPGPKVDGSITARVEASNKRKAAIVALSKALPKGTQLFSVIRDEAVNGTASSVSLLTFNPDAKADGKYNPTPTDMELIATVLDLKTSRAADIKGTAIRVKGVENVGAKLVRMLGDALYEDSAAFVHTAI